MRSAWAREEDHVERGEWEGAGREKKTETVFRVFKGISD